MKTPTRDTLFKPTLSKSESKAEAVSRIAMSMIEQDIEKRDAKTARLRAARLAQEAANATPAPAPAKPAARPKLRKAR